MSTSEKAAWCVGVYGALLTVPLLVTAFSPFTLREAVAHQLIGIHCQFGVYLDQVNIPEGEPGYHLKHDPDRDGVACEQKRVEPPTQSAGGARFVRPI